MRTLCRENGQSTVFAVLFLTVLLGMAALVVDAGSWYRADRASQAAADAAALAGAQALPYDSSAAAALATDYAGRNGGGLKQTSFSSRFRSSDTIRVTVWRTAPGFFARLFGIDSAAVGAKASARATAISKARWAAPIGVDYRHPLLSGAGCPCFGADTTLDLNKVAPGGFRLINLDGSKGGTSPATLASWMVRGLDALMPLGWYYSDPGAKFNSSHMQDALRARIGTELLFPIYRTITGNGSNARYDVIGWVGFVLKSFDARGSSGRLDGQFTKTIWEGIQTETGNEADFGVRAVALVE